MRTGLSVASLSKGVLLRYLRVYNHKKREWTGEFWGGGFKSLQQSCEPVSVHELKRWDTGDFCQHRHTLFCSFLSPFPPHSDSWQCSVLTPLLDAVGAAEPLRVTGSNPPAPPCKTQSRLVIMWHVRWWRGQPGHRQDAPDVTPFCIWQTYNTGLWWLRRHW